ncbi:hypothetical protein Glove_219g63 [Diversispora epigaea]|uniref:Protein kinase domain-containing protein n=1 Tax=Diversispora epigaea TaxID=1348612 RepID=A0A397IKS6_9GLOM|nr:hypothetical protein Glove_219g63 [Diversispora epigaea]
MSPGNVPLLGDLESVGPIQLMWFRRGIFYLPPSSPEPPKDKYKNDPKDKYKDDPKDIKYKKQKRKVQAVTRIKYNGNWCKLCNSKHFQNDFNNWTSGNDKIDKFIQDAQLNANFEYQIIEWIPYNRFKDVKQISRGGLMDELINGTLKINNGKDMIKKRQWKFTLKHKYSSIKFYGITQDPETHSFMIVLEYTKDGNLREYLKINFNHINWNQKLENLRDLSLNLMRIYELDIEHQDFHPGNILSYDFKYNLKISDFGLNSPEKKNRFGVLPYIAPEVLSGEEYTKAADVYSLLLTDSFSSENMQWIIPFHIPKLMTMKCWNVRVPHGPTFNEAKEFSANQESINTTTTTTTILNYQTHPQAIYTKRMKKILKN